MKEELQPITTDINLNRMIFELKIENDPSTSTSTISSTSSTSPSKNQVQSTTSLPFYEDDYLISTPTTKTRNSSTSDSGCTSSTASTNSLSSSLNSNRQSPILSKQKQRIITGVYGRAKNSELTSNVCSSSNDLTQINPNNFNTITAQIINYGDDCAFICNKHLDNTIDRDMNKQLVTKYYFGLADGVSANRLRGYDAKLFPLALLNACIHFIDKLSADESVLRKSSYSDIVINEDDTSSGNEDEDDEEEEENEEQNNDSNCNNIITTTNLNENHEQDDDEWTNFDDLDDQENDCTNLNTLLKNSHDLVQENQVYGSSTACLLSLEFYDLNEYALLSTCNLGDSGYMLIRDGKVIYKSASQSHRYNAPFQLGCTPPELLEHDLYRDQADDSISASHQLKSGDYLIVSSDGLFDNLYEDEIALIILEYINSNTSSSSSTKVTNELLDSACQILVHKASKGKQN